MRRLLKLRWRLLPLLVAAVILCLPFLEGIWNRHQINQTAQAAQAQLDKNPKPAKISGIPNRIVVPSLAIDLPVVPQAYSTATKTWPVAPSVANYASNTAPANNTKGETLIYGHDNRHVFGPLLTMQTGAVVYVYTTNGHVFKYTYTGYQDINPTQVSIIDQMAKAPAGLKLITCTGAYFQYRHLMSLKLAQAS